MQGIATGVIDGDNIIISDQKSGSRLYNRGCYGTPESGGGIRLELIEAFYLLDEQKISVVKNGRKLALEELLTYITKREPTSTFEIRYIVYRDLRLRGHIVKPGEITDFVVYGEAGSGSTSLEKRRVKYGILAFSERAEFKIDSICNLVAKVRKFSNDLVVSIVDEEGDITYYSVSTLIPDGKGKKGNKSKKKAKSQKDTPGTALLVEDRVMLWDRPLIDKLRSDGFYGNIIGNSIQLALTESAYLIDQGILTLKLARTRRKLTLEKFLRIARKIQPDFDNRLRVFSDLKSRNLIVKTGFKYGTHFRVYTGDPDKDHSEYLVHSVSEDFECSWEEISRAVRLAHGVRKQMLFGRIINNKSSDIEYINIKRIKP